MKRLICSLAPAAFLIIMFTVTLTDGLYAQNKGVIRFVFGSDSSTPGIHIRTKTANYRNTNFDLFRSPDRNTARIMEPSFRNRYVDSNGEPFRFTWWMQGGSLYRYATNTNLPFPSLMSLYLMNKYQKESMEQYGDEFTYHYHTWVWSDATGDGIYYWNQTPQYIDSRDDFFLNMAEALIEEDMFAVSFRSGWHFMDNDWQADLDDWIPFSLHNAWPANATGSPEPVNNIYVWKDAPSDWVPFQPRSDNYQLPGGDRGWNTRSTHFRSVREATIREIFEAADQGIDQVPCIWSHVAENTFVEDFINVFELIELVAADYPDIEYRYDTAIEAMQGWLGTTDHTPPVLTVTEVPAGNGYRVRVQTDEPLFMKSPFLAAKDVYERHRHVEMTPAGNLVWESAEVFDDASAVSWSVAATDSSGNQSKYHRDVLPRNILLDDETDAFSTTGTWVTEPYTTLDAVWDEQAHVAGPATSSAAASWQTLIERGAHYDISIRFPSGHTLPASIPYTIYVDSAPFAEGTIESIRYDQWLYMQDVQLSAGQTVTIEIRREAGDEPQTLVADAVKLSAYRPPVMLEADRLTIDLGYVVNGTSQSFRLNIANRGYEQGTITGYESRMGMIESQPSVSIPVGSHGSAALDFLFAAQDFGVLRDTLILHTTDPRYPVMEIPVEGFGKGPFAVTDNEDDERYTETGDWQTSVAQAYGSSSRFVNIREANRDARAEYVISVEKEAWHVASFLVPSAENSAIRALYQIHVNNDLVLEKIANQNAPTNHWKWLGKIWAGPDDQLTITVSLPDIDQPGRVLRADAVQLEMLGSDIRHTIVDNDGDYYAETGTWFTSVSAQSWGESSRYAPWGDSKAVYTVREYEAGLNELSIIVPETENATTMAQYSVYQGSRLLGVTVIDQNVDSGDWVTVGTWLTDGSGELQVVLENAEPASSGRVLRADAIRWSYSTDPLGTSIADGSEMPDQFKLDQNYPNPFNPATVIRFTIGVEQATGHTRLSVYDLLGRRVAVLADGQLAAGTHHVTFDASRLASGIYLYRLESGGEMLNRKMLLLR